MSQQLEIEKCKLKTTKAQQIDCLENVPRTIGENIWHATGLAGGFIIGYVTWRAITRFFKNNF